VGRPRLPPQKLVVLAPNWLGDAVMALPLISDLRRAWPDTRIMMAARSRVAPLYALVPTVDGTITLDGRGDAQRLSAGGFDAALLLPNSFASAWLVRRASIPERWGFARDLRGPLLTHRIRRPRRYGHQAEYYQTLGSALNVASGPVFAAISVPAPAHAAAAALLADNGLGDRQRFVVAAPGAAYGRAKQWPPSRFAQLARRLETDRVRTVLIGSGRDVNACEAVAHEAPVINLSGRTDVATLAGVLVRARAVIANDSGAMHLAAAAGVPVTAIFGPTNDRHTAPLRASPEAPHPVVLTSDVWCRPCMLRQCPIDHRCMTRISADRVYQSLELALS
jgi:heptosyltransferase-2